MTAHTNSVFDKVKGLAVGFYVLLDFDSQAKAQWAQKQLTQKTRFPKELQGRIFTSCQGVIVWRLNGKVSYILKITRVE